MAVSQLQCMTFHVPLWAGNSSSVPGSRSPSRYYCWTQFAVSTSLKLNKLQRSVWSGRCRNPRGTSRGPSRFRLLGRGCPGFPVARTAGIGLTQFWGREVRGQCVSSFSVCCGLASWLSDDRPVSSRAREGGGGEKSEFPRVSSHPGLISS